jgi:hypothetical protein
MSKSQMIATLGEQELLLPDLVSRALSAMTGSSIC